MQVPPGAAPQVGDHSGGVHHQEDEKGGGDPVQLWLPCRQTDSPSLVQRGVEAVSVTGRGKVLYPGILVSGLPNNYNLAISIAEN